VGNGVLVPERMSKSVLEAAAALNASQAA
jgi:hypothetical protein